MRTWTRNGIPCDPIPFDLRESTLFKSDTEFFSHEISLNVDEGSEQAAYVLRFTVPFIVKADQLYCLALVDGKQDVWACKLNVGPDETLSGDRVEILQQAQWGLYQ